MTASPLTPEEQATLRLLIDRVSDDVMNTPKAVEALTIFTDAMVLKYGRLFTTPTPTTPGTFTTRILVADDE